MKTRPLDPEFCKELVRSARWLEKVTVADNGCWHFSSLDHAGYGQINVRAAGTVLKAHRVALVAALGRDLAPGMSASHDCHDADPDCRPDGCQHRSCVNPAHLSEMPVVDNAQASPWANANKTHCPQGHPLIEGNLVAAAMRRGGRNCHTCHIQRGARRTKLVAEAARILGITRREYVAQYGQKLSTARAVIAAGRS